MTHALLQRFFCGIIHRIGTLTLMRVILLWLTLTSIVVGLLTLVGHLPSGTMMAVATLGVLTGWLLGRTRLSGWGSGLAALGIGLSGLLLTIGRIGRPLWAFQSALWSFAWKIQRCTVWPPLKSILSCQMPDLTALSVTWQALVASLTTLTTRLATWFQGIHSGLRLSDPLVTSLLWGTVFWLVVTWAAWWIRRRETIGLGMLPAMTLLVYSIYYTNFSSGILWLVMAGGGWVLLQAQDSYQKSHHRWLEHHMDRAEIEPPLVGMVALLTAGIMLAGGLLPSFSIEKLSNSIQKIFHSEQDQALAESLGLQQTPGMAGKSSSGTSSSNIHGIGPGPELSQDVVMYVTVEGYEPARPLNLPIDIKTSEPDVRYYWRTQTYEQYNGHYWVASPTRTEEIAADTSYYPDLAALPDHYREVRQYIERLQPAGGTLFAAGELLSVDHPSLAVWRASDDLVAARIDAEAYTAVSRIQYVSVDQLRAAGNEYPQSIQRYLDLPDELPARVRDLALDLTIHLPNPYEQALAIETYLRQIPYSLDVPAPPTKQDAADYFLFDLKKGYCDYYATSMVVLARAAGLPARLVIGYTSGSYDFEDNHFVVMEANAHSWVEIYFPGLGWVEFEPTASEPTFPRPGGADQSSAASGIPTPVPGAARGSSWLNWETLRQPLNILGGILAVSAFLLILYWLLPLESWQLSLQSPEQAMRTIYSRLYRRGRVWSIPPDAARTPHEFAFAFSARLGHCSSNPRLASLLDGLRTDLVRLTDLYTRMLFGSQSISRDEQHQAMRSWGRLRRGLRRVKNRQSQTNHDIICPP